MQLTHRTGVVRKLRDYYRAFIADPAAIRAVFDVAAEHSMPTAHYGNACAYRGSPFINNCSYDAAYELLAHLLPDAALQPGTAAEPDNVRRAGAAAQPSAHRSGRPTGRPTGAVRAQLLTFAQTEFVGAAPAVVGMNPVGYVYVPTVCRSGAAPCRLHVAFHGCRQTVEFINSTFAAHAGYNAHAERNGIIVLYPQFHTTPLNPRGCADWWGYTGADYACRLGVQMGAVRRMLERLAGA